MTDPEPVPPPRRPGPVGARDTFVTFQVRFSFGCLGVAALLAVAAIADGGETLAGRTAWHVLAMLCALGVAGLIESARVAWAGRRR